MEYQGQHIRVKNSNSKLWFCIVACAIIFAVVCIFASMKAWANNDWYDSSLHKGQIEKPSNIDVWSNDELQVTSEINCIIDPVSGDTTCNETINFKNLTDDKKIIFNKISAFLNDGFDTADIDMWVIKAGDKTIFEGSAGSEFIPDLSLVPSGKATYNVETTLTGSKAGVLVNTTPFRFVYDFNVKARDAYACVYTSEGGSTDDTLEFRYDYERSSDRWTETFDVEDTGVSDPGWYRFIGGNVGITGSVKTVKFDSSFKDASVKSCYKWFGLDYSWEDLYEQNTITSFIGLDNLNTSNVLNMNLMFSGCHLCESIDVSHFITNKVTSMTQMFSDCYLVNSLDTSNWNTGAVTNMSDMFHSCRGLTILPDVSGWNTGAVTNMSGMFTWCRGLTIPPDVSGWNTGAVTNMSYMFSGCQSITTPPDVSGWNTGSVTNMRYMFSDCQSITTPPDVSGWNTGNVTDMCNMFSSCTKLVEIDISGFTFTNNTQIDSMFFSCTNLEKIYYNKDISNVVPLKESYRAFYNCPKLPNYKEGSYRYGGDLAKPVSQGGVFTPKNSKVTTVSGLANKGVVDGGNLAIDENQLANKGDVGEGGLVADGGESQSVSEFFVVKSEPAQGSKGENPISSVGAVAANVALVGVGIVGARRKLRGKHERLKGGIFK